MSVNMDDIFPLKFHKIENKTAMISDPQGNIRECRL